MTGSIACLKQTVLTYIRAMAFIHAPDELRTRNTFKHLSPKRVLYTCPIAGFVLVGVCLFLHLINNSREKIYGVN